MYSILKKEITSYLSSLVAYVTIGVFLLVLGLFLWVFPESSILEYGYAVLDSLFNTAPYLFMFLIPAITMRSLAEERKEGTFELLLTRPLTDGQIVLGKFFACVVLVLFALIPTLVYYYSVYMLGNPPGNIDTGAVIGSYIGLFLLGSGFAAIGLFASSVSKNQIIAFTIAVFLCFFFYSGFDSLSTLLSLQDLGLQNLGITEHYESVSRGVLDTRDLAYFVCLSAVFIWLTLVVIKLQRQKGISKRGMVGMLAAIILVGFISSFTFTRFDFTKEKRFTLSPVSRKIMGHLQQPVKVTVYLKGDNFLGWMKRLQGATRDMLGDLKAYSHGKLQFDFVDPTAGIKGLSDEEQKKVYDSLEAKGVVGQGFSRKTDNGISQILIFPQALVQYQGQSIAVNLLQSQVGLSDDDISKNSIQNLEYSFCSAIKKITSGGKPAIGFTEGHNELKDVQLYGAMKSLSDGFNVGRVDLKTIPFQALQGIKLLVIPKPDKPFTELEKFKLDQYIMRGGRVLWTIDQVSAELDSLQGHGGEQLSFPKELNLNDQLFVYGVRINSDLIADMRCGQIAVVTGEVGGQPQIQTVPWLFYPILTPLSKNPIVKRLDIHTEFISTIDTIGVKGVKKTILLTSSPYNKKFNTPYMLSLQALEHEPDPKDFQNVPRTVGVLLEGKFKSDFLNRPLPDGLTEKIESLPESVPTKMIVISDGDVLKNDVSQDGTPFPLGYDHYTQQTFGNKNLLLNIADYMTDDSGLIELRTKEIQIRPLDRPKIRSEKLYWQVLNNVVPLAFVLIFAIFQHYIRRRKYAH